MGRSEAPSTPHHVGFDTSVGTRSFGRRRIGPDGLRNTCRVESTETTQQKPQWKNQHVYMEPIIGSIDPPKKAWSTGVQLSQFGSEDSQQARLFGANSQTTTFGPGVLVKIRRVVLSFGCIFAYLIMYRFSFV